MNAKLGLYVIISVVMSYAGPGPTVARQWNELLLEAIRNDYARPTVHARNLYHVSIAMWDAWAVYDNTANKILTRETHIAGDILAARQEALSFAAYRVLVARFTDSPGAAEMLPLFDAKMDTLGYDKMNVGVVGDTPAAIGNRIAANVITFGLSDGSNEANEYEATNGYMPVNPPLVVGLPGNPDLVEPNNWQPLVLDFYIDQSGNVIIGGYPDFLGPHWGGVTPFSLTADLLTPGKPGVYLDPGYPPYYDGPHADPATYREIFAEVVVMSSQLDPDQGPMIDISPASLGNNPIGTYDGQGYAVNPVTGQPYQPQIVPLGDYSRVLAEFWADGPASETPPGHWNVLANDVTDILAASKRTVRGAAVGDLEWDVKLYLALNGAVHDAAVAAWGAKGYYDFIRPISAIRYMAGLGQSSDPGGPSYHPDGIPLVEDVIAVITVESTAMGGIHEHLLGDGGENIGKLAFYAWAGQVEDPINEFGGVEWILADNWVPYQRDTFVTPPFAGYLSGHSTFSRAAAEVMTAVTGSPYFPGGLGSYQMTAHEFLVFEDGPSMDITLQWCSYYDAADEAGLSRLWGGIHPRADDLPGRILGQTIGSLALDRAQLIFAGLVPCPEDLTGDQLISVSDVTAMSPYWRGTEEIADFDGNGLVNILDCFAVIELYGECL